MNPQNPARNAEPPLESWKEIAAYLQRDATTVRRWEKNEGLPVRRHTHQRGASVYAYPSEIDAWRASRRETPEPPHPIPLWRTILAPPRSLAVGVTLALCLMMVGNGIRPQEVSAQQPQGALAARLVCDACGDSNDAALGLDAQWIMTTDWDSGDLARKDLSTGKLQRMLVKNGNWDDSGAHAELSVLSPDGRAVAYTWHDVAGLPNQLRIATDGVRGQTRVLVDSREDVWYRPTGWFPDGESVLVFIQKADQTWNLSRVSVSDGSVTVLKDLGWRLNGVARRASISPDGNYIAYGALIASPKEANDYTSVSDQRIYLLAADGSSETELERTTGINQTPVWTPDGAHILFSSDRSGSPGLWSIGVENGKVQGSARLVLANIGNISLVGVNAGSLYYFKIGPGVEYVSIGEMRSTPGPASVVQRFAGQAGRWSPDGKSIAFKRRRPGTSQDWDLVVHNLETGEEHKYTSNLGAFGAGPPGWFPDGSAVVTGLLRPTEAGRFLQQISLTTGELTDLRMSPAPFDISRDGTSIWTVDNWPEPTSIVRYDRRTGERTQIASLRPGRGGGIVRESPDGKMLAALRIEEDSQDRYFVLVQLDGSGGYREIPVRTTSADFTWMPDSRALLIYGQARLAGPQELLRVPVNGEAPESTGVTLDGFFPYLDLSPDGSLVAFASRKNQDELWSLDNVLAALQ